MKQLVKIKILAIFVASLFILSACDREKMDFGNESDGYGQIQLSSMQLSVDVNATPLSRAVTVDAGSYIVGIYNEDGTTLISEWKYSDMPEIFQLKVGKYKIIAHSPDGGEPVFDVPYCQGSQSIEIQKDQVTNVAKIECKLHCIMVKIGYTDELKPLLGDDTEVTVTINSNDQLTFKMGDEVRAAYFPANESGNIVDFKFLSTLTEDGIKDEVQTVNTRSVSGVSIGYLVTMTYKLSDADGDPNTGGDANASVKVDNSCEVENINGGVRPDEPEIDDFPDGGGDVDGEPTIICKKFDYVLDETVTEENPLEIIVKLNASETIGHVNVQIEAGDDLFGDAIKMMFGEAGTFDLAEPGEYKETLTSLGFPVEEQVVGKTELDFVITQFTPLLRNFPSEKPHKFHITLIDRKGQSVSKTLTFTIKE